MNERSAFSLPGIPLLLLTLAAYAGLVLLFLNGVQHNAPRDLVTAVVLFVLVGFLNKGYFQVQPNQGKVMTLFGSYAGTVRDAGLRWTNPFYAKRRPASRTMPA